MCIYIYMYIYVCTCIHMYRYIHMKKTIKNTRGPISSLDITAKFQPLVPRKTWQKKINKYAHK